MTITVRRRPRLGGKYIETKADLLGPYLSLGFTLGTRQRGSRFNLYIDRSSYLEIAKRMVAEDPVAAAKAFGSALSRAKFPKAAP